VGQEIKHGNTTAVLTLLETLKENASKILMHGRRADSIVNSMLQHSRSGNKQKQIVDLNELVNQYFTLAVEGMKTRDKSFNPSTIAGFDPEAGSVEVEPEEFGRVLINLFDNAFYTIREKKKLLNKDFDPQIKMMTRKLPGVVQVIVEDNGQGMREDVANKIFQPFFTTKPAGQGTGLGLSLGYNIITKGYKGELKVESVEGSGSKFIISLPVDRPGH
jgi:signal transduction histidine kinase